MYASLSIRTELITDYRLPLHYQQAISIALLASLNNGNGCALIHSHMVFLRQSCIKVPTLKG